MTGPVFPSWRELILLVVLAIAVPTAYALALGDSDWLLAAFTSVSALREDPIEAMFALVAIVVTLWLAHRSSLWLRFSQSASTLAFAALGLAIVWPWVDERVFVHEMHERYRSFRGIDILFWRDHFDAVAEGALIGLFGAAAWLIVRPVVISTAQSPQNPAQS